MMKKTVLSLRMTWIFYEFFKRVEDDTYSYIDGQSIDLLNDVIKDEYKLKKSAFLQNKVISELTMTIIKIAD